MIKNHFKIAWRSLVMHKLNSLIYVVGLAAGMSVALLICLWIVDEINFNSYFTDHEKIARAVTNSDFDGRIETNPAISIPVGYSLQTNYQDAFRHVALTSWNTDHLLTYSDKSIMQSGMWVQESFPAIFTLKVIGGDLKTLNNPSSILISGSVAKALFGSDDPIGKAIRVDNKAEMKVSGVFEDLPANTQFSETKLLLPWSEYIKIEGWVRDAQTNWGSHSFQLFVRLNDRANPDIVGARIRSLARPHWKEDIMLHPLDKWHLYSQFTNGRATGGRVQLIWLFGTIGIFVLLLACINFMNLSTARVEKRAKDVGIRKALGTRRVHLIAQFLIESILVAFLAFIVAMGLTLLFLPAFNHLAGKEMHVPWASPVFWGGALGFTLLTGVIAGSYPAIYLSSFRPVSILKGIRHNSRYSSLPRKILVIVQFTVSVSLITTTIIVFQQIRHARNRPSGYNRERLLTVSTTSPLLYTHYDAIRNDLLATGAVDDMGQSTGPVTSVWSNIIGFDWKGKDPKSAPLFGVVLVSHDFGKTIGWRIVEGRDFSRDFKTDSGCLIMNKTAANLVGFKNSLGQEIIWQGAPHKIVGVIDDMVMESPYAPIKPTFFCLAYGASLNEISLKLNSNVSLSTAVGRLMPIFRKYDPGNPFLYHFVGNQYEAKFSDEGTIGRLALVFSILAIFISCLGLYGMVSYMGERRRKEICIRKVLGAPIILLWKTLAKEFAWLIIVSCCIAAPIAWIFANVWLQQYQYRTPIYAWVFILVSFGALLIGMATISYQVIKASLINPAEGLRLE